MSEFPRIYQPPAEEPNCEAIPVAAMPRVFRLVVTLFGRRLLGIETVKNG